MPSYGGARFPRSEPSERRNTGRPSSQFDRKRIFYIRLNNGTRAVEDEKERERYIAQRWGRA